MNSYTVNVYYKPGHPGVGSYNLDYKPDHAKGGGNFHSKTKRNPLFIANINPDLPIQYNTKGTFGSKSVGYNNSPGLCQPTNRKLVHLNLFGDGNEKKKFETKVYFGI